MKIGELAKNTDCSVETIRYYESEGLLPPVGRNASNYREYSEAHRKRIAFILRCRALDMSLGEIRDLISIMDGEESSDKAHEIIHLHMNKIDQQIAALEHLKEELIHLNGLCCGHGRHEDCGIIRGLAEEDPK